MQEVYETIMNSLSNAELVLTWKYFSCFCISLEMSMITCEIKFIKTCSTTFATCWVKRVVTFTTRITKLSCSSSSSVNPRQFKTVTAELLGISVNRLYHQKPKTNI